MSEQGKHAPGRLVVCPFSGHVMTETGRRLVATCLGYSNNVDAERVDAENIANAERIMQAQRAAGLVEERQYYAARLNLLNRNSAAEEAGPRLGQALAIGGVVLGPEGAADGKMSRHVAGLLGLRCRA